MNTRDYAIYIAGMDNNVDLIRCAVKCIRQSTKIDCRFYVGVEQATTNEKDVIEVAVNQESNGPRGSRTFKTNSRR